MHKTLSSGFQFNSKFRTGRSHISAYDYGLFPFKASNKFIPQDMGFRAESVLAGAHSAARDYVVNNGTLMNRAYDFDTGDLLSFSGQIHNCFARPNKLRRIHLLVNRHQFSLPELKAHLKWFHSSSGRHLNDLLTVMEREAVTLYKWNPANTVVTDFIFKQTNYIPYLQIKGKQFSRVCHHRRYTLRVRFTKRADEPMRFYEIHSPRPLEGESMREFVERRDKNQAYRYITWPMQAKEKPWVYPMADVHEGWGLAKPQLARPLRWQAPTWNAHRNLAYGSMAPW